jgi:hypothetical protein
MVEEADAGDDTVSGNSAGNERGDDGDTGELFPGVAEL